MTCAGCHFDPNNGNPIPTADRSKYINDPLLQVDCSVDEACVDYGFGTHTSIHTQGVQESDGNIYWLAEEVTSYEHGVQASRHVNTGRNEDYSAEHRQARGDSFFTNSPGMFGKW